MKTLDTKRTLKNVNKGKYTSQQLVNLDAKIRYELTYIQERLPVLIELHKAIEAKVDNSPV